jgi:undecaprenyl-diphosphatase
VTLLAAALLGIVQGVTEFLPISSSAHLILARAFFGWDATFGLAFDVSCHVGTLVALLTYFREDVRNLLSAIPRMLNPAGSTYATLAWLLIVGTVPVALAGLLFSDWISSTFRTPGVAALCLALGALLLFLVERIGSRPRDIGQLRLSDALLVGSAQALALIPGVSRSGATIAMAMLLGLRRDAAARFGFLLGIPAVTAAAVHEAPNVVREIQNPGVPELFVVGVTTSAIVGYFVIKYLIRYLTRHSLDAFAYYRLLLAAATVAWLLTVRH